MGVVDGCEPWELFLFSKREMELQKKKKCPCKRPGFLEG